MDEPVYYLSGPMTGLPDYNYPNFNRITKELRAQGYKVVSPAETEESLGFEQGSQKWPWDEWMRHAMRSLLECNSIIMMPGWCTSKGARAELDMALDLEMAVYRLLRTEDNRLHLVDMYDGFYLDDPFDAS